jgi:hypothetical protein
MKIARIPKYDPERVTVTERVRADVVDLWKFAVEEITRERVRMEGSYDYDGPERTLNVGGAAAGLKLAFRTRLRLYDGRRVEVEQTVPEPVVNELLEAEAEQVKA